MFDSSLNNPYVIESYNNGTNWYKVYSDGWIEQGGLDSVPTGGHTCNLLKPYKDTNYNVVANSTSAAYFATIGTRSTSGFGLYSFIGDQGYGSSILWRACGQGA